MGYVWNVPYELRRVMPRAHVQMVAEGRGDEVAPDQVVDWRT